ncbi:carbohydrate-binding protein [Catenuloplanes japonicus]|uniref:carbohydrate-binding protein n=1 Tax=Catenuloplanes japonicus TaxID=33876 RepID=UPI0005271576|nr:carbohydrate-binding protein [Catenuloplanes japonicus]
MKTPSRVRTGALAAAALVTVAGGLVVTGNATASAAAACGVLFDDFNYTSPSDSAFTGHGWTARSNAGGPGVPGASWSASNISFPTVDGQKVAQLQASTDGTAAGTTHAEFLQNQLRFFEGTYAARIKFSDAPVSGPDGDHINETFFAIGPAQRFDYDPLYSELDFSEYLPNGGWGVTGSINYQTSWNGYKEEPWDPYNAHSQQTGSLAGWHTVAGQVANGHVKYFIDGVQVGDHTVSEKDASWTVYPRAAMSINFNLWFIDLAAHNGGRATYQEHVDWVYYAKNESVSPADLTSRTAAYRSAGTTHQDTISTGTGCSTGPTTTPTTAPPTTTPPTTTPPTTPPPTSCAGANPWAWGTVYLAGDRATHNGHLWQANWWTQGSEPGLTAQWRDLGTC